MLDTGEQVAKDWINGKTKPRCYEFAALCAQLVETHRRKDADYSGDQPEYANMKKSSELGIPPSMGCLLRMQDKFERVLNLTKKPPEVANESLEDTLIDLAAYSLICVILRRGERTSASQV